MKLNELKPARGSRFKKKRVGRGTSSGLGKTGGRGHKGQASRSGGTKGARFEGGQTPLYRRLPKRGFKNYPFRVRYSIFNLNQLDRIEAAVKSGAGLIKVLGGGEVKGTPTVSAHKFSQSAKKKIEVAGGKAVILNA
ncbi:50S ribosomal protein L15 [candidate division WOR-1 bacterium RIFCSPHIGHO2_01_FULL_53_15]|uniref:Large ribosomal subunit protein uL15 n=1 Tax=candidate division WOR-1 bacterium RIFCSPHIGHO2_01_FULL_53_15 TaxID=1802564 RepID=A0A1F4Q3R7_UNCSA|nr:MAG: 50S ribosomal protein L15 [candidate division WOR-1 bacterium RIFCSPHIGHO2_01_FULL_53_15]OGC12498.1 MAG: 50S ribosomal protein L15 [candidate division WOR-1 bacterium RIFCSPHIGHO2_02_FULL_53_26]